MSRWDVLHCEWIKSVFLLGSYVLWVWVSSSWPLLWLCAGLSWYHTLKNWISSKKQFILSICFQICWFFVWCIKDRQRLTHQEPRLSELFLTLMQMCAGQSGFKCRAAGRKACSVWAAIDSLQTTISVKSWTLFFHFSISLSALAVCFSLLVFPIIQPPSLCYCVCLFVSPTSSLVHGTDEEIH